MDPLFDWVDKDPPLPTTTFSSRRTAKLLIAIMLSGILAGIPVALLNLGILKFTNDQAERQKQEQLQKGWQDLEKAAREGKTGVAFKRLVGAEPPLAKPKNEAH